MAERGGAARLFLLTPCGRGTPVSLLSPCGSATPIFSLSPCGRGQVRGAGENAPRTKKRAPIPGSRLVLGGAEGIRTPGLVTASHARSQLRHSPKNADGPTPLRFLRGVEPPIKPAPLYLAGPWIVKENIPLPFVYLSLTCPVSSLAVGLGYGAAAHQILFDAP